MCHLCDAREAVAAQATSRRRFLGLTGGIAAGLALSSTAWAKDTKPPKPQNVVSPDEALDRLMKGNARYVEGISRRHDFKHEREALAGGQNPFAAILSCAIPVLLPNTRSTAVAAICSSAASPAISPMTTSWRAWNIRSPSSRPRCSWCSATKAAARWMRRSSR